ncbi:PREDICTED: epithelial chloride channel protein-like [Branchiostoma belcheri]|uniref:Epithelial chloride channel protein-like n=1 Tax=Branchiostoma belcheri TaxID=7741 RepID=A0A6P4XU81_BRABE|nr:PREDICTED: epithelial chloride channel protein-like [Branchiostoma belcheri]
MPRTGRRTALLGLLVSCLFLCCFHVHGAARLQNNAYQDVVVAIANSVPEDGALLASLRVKFNQASAQLFAATGGRAYFGTVKILVPRTWDYYGSYQYSRGERFGRAEIRVGPAVGGLGSFTRSTARTGTTCGTKGDFMYLATNMITRDTIVEEWGRYRWGVDGGWALGSAPEESAQTTEVAPTTQAAPETDATTLAHASTESAGSASTGSSNATGGFTETPAVETEAYPEPEPTQARVVTAPPSNEGGCSGQAAWDTILATEDFTNGQNPPDQDMNIPDVTFEFLYQTEIRREVLVLDSSGSMGRNLLFKLRQVLTSHIYNLPMGSSLGIVTFSDEATVNAQMTVIGNETTRVDLVGALPMATGGRTSIGSGLQAARGLLGSHLGRIILISDGQEDEQPYIETVLPALRSAGHTVYTVAIGEEGDPMLDQLARDTGGVSFSDTRYAPNLPGILSWVTGIGEFPVRELCHGGGEIPETRFCFDVEPDMTSYPDPPCGWGTKVTVTSGQSDLSVPPISVQGAFSDTSVALGSGDSVVLYALVEKDYACVVGADVTAVISRPYGRDVEVTLKDDGQGVDAYENDGIYSATFERYLGNGRYNMMVKVLGSSVLTQVDMSCVAGVSGGRDVSESDSESVSDFDRVVAVGAFQVSGYDGPLEEEEETDGSPAPESEPVAVIAMGAGVGAAGLVALLIILGLVVLKKKGKRAQTAPSPTQMPIDDSFSIEDEEEMGIANGTDEKQEVIEEQEEEAEPVAEPVVQKRTPTPPPPVPVAMPTVEEPVIDPAVREEQRRQEEERRRQEAERKKQEMEKARRIQMEDQLLKDVRRALRSGDRKEVSAAEDQYKAGGMYDDANISPEIAKLREIWNITDGLKVAIAGRRIKEVEPAVEIARAACENMTSSGRITLPADITNKAEKEKVKQEVADRKQKALEDLQVQVEEGEKVLKTLKHLEKLRHEVLEMKQSTVAEIRNYGHPPPQVHTVMISTYLMLGTPESQTQNWQAVQALMGKTGKQGIKRMVAECDPDMIPREKAERAAKLLSEFDLAQVRDVSAGAATFYVWVKQTCDDILRS